MSLLEDLSTQSQTAGRPAEPRCMVHADEPDKESKQRALPCAAMKEFREEASSSLAHSAVSVPCRGLTRPLPSFRTWWHHPRDPTPPPFCLFVMPLSLHELNTGLTALLRGVGRQPVPAGRSWGDSRDRIALTNFH